MELSTQKEKQELIKQALGQLEDKPVLLDGKLIKPSQCYRFLPHPPHVLYNTNCPEDLMDDIEAILLKYKPVDEERSKK